MDPQRPAVCARVAPRPRCPYCHDAVHQGGVDCGSCGALHHSVCADEHAACASCGYGLEDVTYRVRLREAEARRGWWWTLVPGQRDWHRHWQRWRRQVWRPALVGAVAVGCALAVACHLLWRWLTG